MMQVSDKVKAKLAEAIEIWRDDNLDGKPSLLATGVYFNLVKFLEDKTVEIEATFS
jgi:hypothetical protein